MKFTIYIHCVCTHILTLANTEKRGVIQNVPQLNRITGLLKTTHIKK